MSPSPSLQPAPRRQFLWKEILTAPALIAAVTFFIIAVDNRALWREAWRATLTDEHRIAILWSLFALMFFTLTTLLSLALGRTLLKSIAVILLLVAATCSYFMGQYGVIVDQSMIRNVVQTTALEATPLIGRAYAAHLFLYGVVPAIAVASTPLPALGQLTNAVTRLATAVLGVAALMATLFVNYGSIASFGQQNRGLRLLLNPVYPLYAAATFAIDAEAAPRVREPLDLRLSARPAGKPAVIVFVMGETARADRFSLNGYKRDTNRYTRPRGVVNFASVRACGTSTADSVPCIFSGLGHAAFDHREAGRRESLFGGLQRLGVSTFWRDNSTGCKEVCDEGHFEERAGWNDSRFCDATGCFDEVLLDGFDGLLADRSRDHFIVLHQRGSHGPAYHTDTPRWAKEYVPECTTASLRDCGPTALDNAYDNTIVYTDFFLSRVIDELEKHTSDFDTAMIYVSDHGESLGERGVYLHGLPYSIAPNEQIEVPMMLWASPGFYDARARVDPACLRRSAEQPTTHDAIFHTLLPLLGVESPYYDATLDLLAACRGVQGSASHE